MPVFAYKGFDARGKNVSGMRDADNVRMLKSILKKDGVFLTEAKEAALRARAAAETAATVAGDFITAFTSPRRFLQRLAARSGERQQVSILTRQLGTLLKAGVPLAEALGALVDQVDRPALKQTLAEVKTQVNEGTSLGDAMSRFPSTFPDLYVNMVRAGEASGSLEIVLRRLSEFLDAQNRLRSKVSSALFYPIVMMFIGIIIMGILMVSVVPKVTAIFEDTGRALPWNTQLLISLSHFFAAWWWSLPIFVGLIWYAIHRWRSTPEGRLRSDRIILKIPVLGPLARMVAIARFAKTLATMLSSGVPLLRALDIVKAILGNAVLTKVLEEAKASISEGESIATPLRRSGEFPPVVSHMIAVGERSGQLEEMLVNVAEAYEIEVDLKIARLTTLLEPMMILIMGGSVAFVVFSILMPIMEMTEFVS